MSLLRSRIKGTSALNPLFKIKLRISCCEDSQGIEVPLGDYCGEEWDSHNYELDWESLAQEDITEWLLRHSIYDFPEEDECLEFDAAAQATLKRCLVLATASAKSNKTRGRRRTEDLPL